MFYFFAVVGIEFNLTNLTLKWVYAIFSDKNLLLYFCFNSLYTYIINALPTVCTNHEIVDVFG